MSKTNDNNRIKNILVGVLIGVFCLLMALIEWLPITYSKDALYDKWIGRTLQQLCGIAAGILLLYMMKIKLFGKIRNWLYLLPCLVIAVNNFQWWSYFNGLQTLVRTNALDILLFAVYCLSVGMFEEFIFRGVLFSVVASYFPKNKKGFIWTYVVTSLVFAVAHIFNGNLLQVLYTILTGGLFAFVLIKTKNLLCCGFVHGLYNFCGLLMDKESNLGLGKGVALFEWGTVLTMGIVAICMIAFVLYSLYKYTEEERKTLYECLGLPEKQKESVDTQVVQENAVECTQTPTKTAKNPQKDINVEEIRTQTVECVEKDE